VPEIAGEVINRTKRLALVDGIKYQKIGDESYFAQELFQQEELIGYLRNILKDTTKSVFEHVVYDSAGVERTFAEQLEKNESVKVYAKLPAWFKVPTPLGSYNPDWAVALGPGHWGLRDDVWAVGLGRRCELCFLDRWRIFWDWACPKDPQVRPANIEELA
jgi:hypothetical protein